jgi:hypothetical protein
MLLGLGELPFLSGLPPVSANDAQLPSGVVPLQPDIEPLVRLLEETPRGRLLEEVAARVRRGLSYGESLTALLLAGVRNIQPRPQVGFKFHAVLVVNSVHLASLSAADTDRWLPLFWALDYFKDSQARNQDEGGWRMKPVDEAAVPPGPKARQAFSKAMDAWDEAAADAATGHLHLLLDPLEPNEFSFGTETHREHGARQLLHQVAEQRLRCLIGLQQFGRRDLLLDVQRPIVMFID